MKLKYTLETMELDDELVAVPVGGNANEFHGILKVNETAAAILKLLAEETSEAQVIASIQKQFTGDPAEIAAAVKAYLAEVREAGLLAE